LPVLAGVCLLALIFERWFHRRTERKHAESELLRFSNLHFLTRALSESTDPREMAEQTLERTLQMFDATQGYVLLDMRGSEAVHHSSAKGFSSAARTRLGREPLRTYLASSAERWGSLMVFPDLRRPILGAVWQRDRAFEDFRQVFIAEGLRTLVAVGLQIKERAYGALLVGSRSLRVFEPAELRLILAVGNQVSVALENRYLRKVSERHDQELKILHRVAEALRATFDLQTQVQILPRELASLIGCQNFSLALQDSPGGRLETVVGMENGEPAVPETPAQTDGLSDYVLRTRAPLLIAQDLAGVAKRLGITSFDPRIRTWCGVPIRFSDGSMGVLAVADFEREKALDEKKFQLLQVLADEAAVAIENARLFQREYRRTRHLSLLNELGRKAMAVLDPQDLLPKVCEELRAAFGYELVRVEKLDRERGELAVEAQEGYGEEVLGRRFRLGQGLSGMAAETGEPAFSNARR